MSGVPAVGGEEVETGGIDGLGGDGLAGALEGGDGRVGEEGGRGGGGVSLCVRPSVRT